MIRMVLRASLALALSLSACAGKPLAEPPPARASSSAPSAPASAPVVVAPAPAVAASYRNCGQGCKAFPGAIEAFDHVMARPPRVLGVGEAHAQSAGPKVPSTTRRFMDSLLPRLAPRAADLVLEIWLANGSCGQVEQKVQQQQKEVTAPQAASNQNDFLELGHRAKALGIMPRALVPTCEQYQKIASAGADDIAEMLAMIKAVTLRDVTELLSKRAPDRMIVAYGGAMHNDLVPRAGREDFSFGPELASATGGSYVELDLIVPEQIKDTETWRAQPWYGAYAAQKPTGEAYLLSWAEHAHALIFPPTPAEAAP